VQLPDESALGQFWKGRDPLFLTSVNERLMEHCRRVAYANLRFSDPTRSIAGWQTDRGQVYIRYGKPLSRYMKPGDIDLGLDKTTSEEANRPRGSSGVHYDVQHRTETWGYEGVEITFENTTSWDSWRFIRAWDGHKTLEWGELIERFPESYRHPWIYEAPHQVAQFRGADAKTRVEVYYALPAEQVAHQEVKSGLHAVDLRKGLFLFDADWDTVRQEVVSIVNMPWIEDRKSEEGYLLWGERLALGPGVCRLAVEAEDRTTKRTGTFRDSMVVRSYGGDTLMVSDVLLARRIVEQEDRPFGRDRFMVLPNPLKQSGRNRQAWFYFEVYNLKRDEFGATNYRISYQMRRLAETPAPGNSVPEWTTAVSHTFRRSRAWEPHHLALDLKDTAPGLWAFRVVVDDLQGEAQAMASTGFRVVW
jgi:GWxTD domain-containing protein